MNAKYIDLEDWQLRVITEKARISDRLNVLNSFLHPTWINPDYPIDSELLKKQYEIMMMYLEILDKRVDNFLNGVK